MMEKYPQVSIDLKALRHNLGCARRAAPDCRVMAVIKADAYGHGMRQVARALDESVDRLAVARIDEAVTLSQWLDPQRIVVLEGFNSGDELAIALQYGFELVLHHASQLQRLRAFSDRVSGRKTLSCWLKFDTGMHRLGFQPDELDGIIRQTAALSGVLKIAGVMTHLANADDLQDATTNRQLDSFNKILAGFEDAAISIANSAGILGWPASHADWIRPGIMLYGSSPFGDSTAEEQGLLPVMTLSSHLIAINHYRKGDAVGYGGSWVCPEDMPVGVVAVGYGDGYPRHLPSGTPVLLKGKRSQLLGRVSMDMISIDLRGLDATVGDEVVLWGKGLPADDIARAAGTIAYELFCGVTARVNRHYQKA